MVITMRNSSVAFKATPRKGRKKSKLLPIMPETSATESTIKIACKSRREILDTFLSALLIDSALRRDIKFKKAFDSTNSEFSDAKDFKDVGAKDLDSSSVVGANGSKLLLSKVFMKDPADKASVTMPTELTRPSADVLKDLDGSITPNLLSFLKMETIYFKNGNIYQGTTNECLMHGEGRFIWEDNAQYRGEFRDGYITGKGEMILPDLTRYEGEFCEGFFHGSGFLNIASTPTYYNGEWKNGQKDGKGWILYEAGDWYEGEWKQDLRHGKGFRKYKSGAKYKGDWFENKKQGKGKMLHSNNDYYCGEWYNDERHGYGEYTWDLVYNKTFCFPIYNWYKGSWKEGRRDGIGIMNFGTDCGARYAGTWSNNLKHGPGVMLSGNGLILESNPLFEFNKSVQKSSQVGISDFIGNSEEKSITDFGNKSSYYQILKLIQSQTAYSKLDDSILANITYNSLNIPPHMYTLLEAHTLSPNRPLWCPLDIPTHIKVEEVDLKYFVELIFDVILGSNSEESLQSFHLVAIFSEKGFQRQSQLVHRFTETGGIEQVDTFMELPNPGDAVEIAKERELKKLRNSIVIYLLKLKTVYNKYASFAKSKSGAGDVQLEFKPVLVRFYLWQLFRDINISRDGVELHDIDMLLWNNPASCLDTESYPFEPIYFFQFIQYLMGAAWLVHLKKYGMTDELQQICLENIGEQNLPSKIFRSFLDSKLEKIELLRDSCLNDHFNIVPMHRLYDVYIRIADPMSVKSFVTATYNDGEEPPCYLTFVKLPQPETRFRQGYNAVPVAHEVYYIHDQLPFMEKPINEDEILKDTFSHTLYIFRTLGQNVIVDTIAKVIPAVMSKSKIFNWGYKLTFLEFYEIIIRLTFLKAEQELKKEEEPTMEIPTISESSYRVKTKKKKTK